VGLRAAQIYTWLPAGLSDNREAATTNIGDCRVLKDLIHDPTSKGVLAPRAAAVPLTNFTGFTSPGVVSVHYIIGTRIYGMIASGLNAGYDQPFCYDTSISAFVTISGITSANVPLSPPTTGAWTPPAMILVGVKLMLVHPGFVGGTNYIGWIDLTNPAAPVWNAGNTTGAGGVFTSTPVTLGTFNNRAWYGFANGLVVFSDILSATTVTNAGQNLQCGATDAITGFAPQPLTTGTQGILSALLIFKATSIWQVTGDYSSTTAPLALNELTDSVGTLSPRSVTPTPDGTFFLANDGIRTVTLVGQVSEPQPDVIFPFYNVSPASRASADYAADVYRISVTSVNNQGTLGKFDYWYSLRFNRWTGPHSFSYDNVVAFGNTFVLSSNDYPAMLWTSNPFPSSSDTYIEHGNQMTIQLTTTAISPDPPMAEKASVEMEVNFVPSPEQYNVQVLDASGNALQAATLQSAVTPASWGTGTWGLGTWGAAPYNLESSPLYFAAPLVFKTCVVQITGQSALYLRFGRFSFRYEGMGYTGQDT
jgi:hypothetical protein